MNPYRDHKVVAEEREAWDRYAASCLAICTRADLGDGCAEVAKAAANFADAMLAERRRRFGKP